MKTERRAQGADYALIYAPGSDNQRERSGRKTLLRAAELSLWCAASILLGCYAAVYLDRSLYQEYRAWEFDRLLERKSAPVLAFVAHELRGGGTPAAGRVSQDSGASFPQPPSSHAVPNLTPGALVGRILIPRIGLRAMIVNGTGAWDLSRAVGHIEGTPLFGRGGNVGLAGHRDTFFRGLRDIRRGDAIEIKTLEGTFNYVVDAITIVGPGDTGVLDVSERPRLTLVTCYPFDYIGPAPQRFIVQAHEAGSP